MPTMTLTPPAAPPRTFEQLCRDATPPVLDEFLRRAWAAWFVRPTWGLREAIDTATRVRTERHQPA